MGKLGIVYSLLISLACVSCTGSSQQQPVSELLDVDTFQKQITSDKGFVLLDLRTDKEVAEGVIQGAQQLDFLAPDFAEKAQKLDKDKTYYIYCAAGGRSGKAAKLMQEMGFSEVYDLKGGMTDWKARGKEVVPLK